MKPARPAAATRGSVRPQPAESKRLLNDLNRSSRPDMLQCNIIRVYAAPHKTGTPCRTPQETAMNNRFNQFNDQFASASRQFADTAAPGQPPRPGQRRAGVRPAAGRDRAERQRRPSPSGASWPKPVTSTASRPCGRRACRSPARTSSARSRTGQEVLGRTLKTNEAIGQIAKGQFERATAQANAVAAQANEQVNQAANDVADQASAQFNKAAKQAK